MDQTFVIAAGLLLLSVVSGMLGLGVAFAAVPFLAFFMADLVHEIQPLSLFLNGVTALFSAFGFAWSGLVAWRPALLLAVVTTIAAPFGAWLAQFIPQSWIWGMYFIAVAYLAARMFLPEKPEAPHTRGKRRSATPHTNPPACRADLSTGGSARRRARIPAHAGPHPCWLCSQAGGSNQCGCGDATIVLCAYSTHIDDDRRSVSRRNPDRRRRSRIFRRRATHQPVRFRRVAETDLRPADRRDDGVQAFSDHLKIM